MPSAWGILRGKIGRPAMIPILILRLSFAWCRQSALHRSRRRAAGVIRCRSCTPPFVSGNGARARMPSPRTRSRRTTRFARTRS
ncbi:hypothetical protein B0H16DRAFT_1516893 [Mycena metata]|uniref:Uncharacterized protein n=1 Tax=Mycena metata TaxID=1033252 RepID=A0AAD7JQN2_9AGAR|nr:hypothetical protein B0H16DRAFT_1516893 [Mycena metata]